MDVARSSLKLFGARIGTTVVSFVALAYFARRLGSAQMGVFFLFQASVTMLAMGTDVGLATAIEKRISGGKSTTTTLSTGGALIMALVVVVSVFILLFRRVVNGYIGADVAGLLVAALALQQAMRLLFAGIRGDLRVAETADLQIVSTVVQFGLAGALVALGFDARALILGLLGGIAAGVLVGAVKLRPSVARPDPAQARSLLGYAKYNIIPSVGLQVHNWMDILIVGWLLTQSAVGIYEIAWRVAGVTTLLASAIGIALLPQTSALEAAENTERIGRMVSATFLPALVLIVPATFGTLVLAPDILGVVFGSEYATAGVVLIVLVGGKGPEAVQMIVGKTLLGIDRPDLVARATVVTLVSNLLLNVALVSQFGLIGAAVATTLSFTAGVVLRYRYLAAQVPLRFPSRQIGWCVVASGAMAVVLAVARNAMVPRTFVQLFSFVGLGVVAYGAVVLLHPSLRRTLFQYAGELLPVSRS